ncbi:MAG: hypothetical protein ABSB40_09140 [Nitrososphaeria archaeon]
MKEIKLATKGKDMAGREPSNELIEVQYSRQIKIIGLGKKI